MMGQEVLAALDHGESFRDDMASDVFVARQPIFDRRLHVEGYELLFAARGDIGFPAATDPTLASAAVIANGLIGMGSDLTGGLPAWITVTRDLLVSDHVLLFPSTSVVVEVGTDVVPDDEVVRSLAGLKTQHYRTAIGGFTLDDARWPLVGLVDAVKIDFSRSDAGQRRLIVDRLRERSVDLVAEQVESQVEHLEALALGCNRVQGFFFTRPTVHSARRPRGFKPVHSQLLEAAFRPEIDFAEIEDLLRRDLMLADRFLRYLNTAAFGWRRRIDSLKHALVLLGEKGIRRWATLVILAAAAEDKPHHLLVSSSVRARLCESLADLVGLEERRLDAFLLGMFSMMDAVLDRPLEEALEGLPIHDDVTAALLGFPNRLRPILDTAIACERGDWSALQDSLGNLGVDPDEVWPLNIAAWGWALDVFK